MRKTLALAAILVVLAGCSMQTRYTLSVDVLSFLGDEVEGNVPSGAFEVYLPDDDGDLATPDLDGTLVEGGLGADRLEAARLELTATITNTGATPLDLSAEAYVGDKDTTDLYHGGGTLLGSASLNLDPGESGALTLVVELKPGDPGFDLVAAGSFRVGTKLHGSGDGFSFRLEELKLALTTKRLGELLQP